MEYIGWGVTTIASVYVVIVSVYALCVSVSDLKRLVMVVTSIGIAICLGATLKRYLDSECDTPPSRICIEVLALLPIFSIVYLCVRVGLYYFA